MRGSIICFLIISSVGFTAHAQHDSLPAKANSPASAYARQAAVPPVDSAAVARAKREQFIADSIGMAFLKPDSLRKNLFLAKIFQNDIFNPASYKNTGKSAALRMGARRAPRDPWVIIVLIGLLTYTALLNLFLGKDVKSVVQTFYNKRVLSPIDKEGGVIHSWAFIGLFVLFSLASGLVLSQLTVYYHIHRDITGIPLFIWLSVLVGALFTVKFFLLKFIGFVFDINRYVGQYITILNLTYFNIGFVLLFAAMCFSLLQQQYIPYLKFFTAVAITVIFAWQYLRNSVNIISNFRFHKFYLFIYLCALEICPVLILIKALDI